MNDDFEKLLRENATDSRLNGETRNLHQAYLSRVSQAPKRRSTRSMPNPRRQRLASSTRAMLTAGITAGVVVLAVGTTSALNTRRETAAQAPAVTVSSTLETPLSPVAGPSGSATSRTYAPLTIPTTLSGENRIDSADDALALAGTSTDDPEHPGSKAILTTIDELQKSIPSFGEGSKFTDSATRGVWAVFVNKNFTPSYGVAKQKPRDWGVLLFDAPTGVPLGSMASFGPPPEIFAN